MAGKSCREGVSVLEFAEIFPDDEAARCWFEAKTWTNGRHGPRCGHTDTIECKGEPPLPYWCPNCNRHFSVRIGTIMERSPLPFRKWVFAIYLHLTSLKGVSSMKVPAIRKLGMTLAAALRIAVPAAAGDTGFDFDKWFMGLSTKERPEVGIRLDPERLAGGYCESALMNEWPSCFTLVFFRIYIRNDKPNTTGRPLTIDLSWTTATGLSGQEIFQGSPVIGVNRNQSGRVVFQIPDDAIAHGCNKLIVTLRSLMLSVYKIMPYTWSQGFEYVTYIDNDDRNPDTPPDEEGRVDYYKMKFTKYCN